MKTPLNNSQIKTVTLKISKEMTKIGNDIFIYYFINIKRREETQDDRDLWQSVILVKGTDQELNHSIIEVTYYCYYYYYYS
jgi:hypothetical protein